MIVKGQDRGPVPPRVFHLISSSGFLGAENVALELAVQCRERGCDVSIGALVNADHPNHDLAEEASRRHINVTVYPCAGRLDRTVMAGIAHEISNERVDILHSHNYKSNYYAWRAMGAGRPGWVVTNHGRRSGLKLFFYNLADAFVAGHADRVVAVSEKIARKLRRAGIGRERLRIIDNGIDTRRFEARPAVPELRDALGIPASARVIGTVGALTREKGQIFLLQAAPVALQSFPSAFILIVGDGPERGALEEEAVKLGIRHRVVFAGSRKDIPDLLGVMDVFVFPSLSEGLPMALLEAQASGTPTVATRVGAIPSVILDQVSGLLIPPADQDAIAGAVVRILSDPVAASMMAAKGAERVRENFSARAMADGYLALYHEILRDRKGLS